MIARTALFAAFLSATFLPLCSVAITGCSTAVPNPPGDRLCGLVVWHKPASRDARVEIIGDWDGWRRPGVVPEIRADGWVQAAVDATPGEHAYAILEDGVWLADRQVPLTTFYKGKEVALGVALDCERPALHVDEATGTADGNVVVRASFQRALTGAPLDPASVVVQSGEGAALRAVRIDPDTGSLRFESTGFKRGKYTFSMKARDASGAETDDAVATAWVEPRAWDPRDAVVYQVVLDRFRGSDGQALRVPARPSDRAGGTLEGLRKAVESGEIEALGVDTLWLSPLYQNPEGEFAGSDGRPYSSYHGYWPKASRMLDARVATEEELDRFMRASHERGIRVLFDVVPNHVHEQHPWVKEHPDWFKTDCICGQGSCDWATHIKTCWFTPYLPDLDWTNLDAARAETADVMWWFDRWGADGVRIDAVPMMPRAATRRIVQAVRARYEHPGQRPYLLGENFTGPGGYQSLRYDLGPFGLDGSFNFPLMWTLRAALASETASMSDIEASFRAGEKAWVGAGALMAMMIDNHDVSRFASVSAGTSEGDSWLSPPQPTDPVVYAKQRVALATVLTLPGAPVLFYGDEVGLAGRNDPDSRRVMPGEGELFREQVETRSLVRKVGRARACSDALRRGSLRTILADGERFIFARELDGDPSGAVIVALSRRPSRDAEVALSSAFPPSLVDVVTGTKVDSSRGVIAVPRETFGVHIYVPAGSACSAQ